MADNKDIKLSKSNIYNFRYTVAEIVNNLNNTAKFQLFGISEGFNN